MGKGSVIKMLLTINKLDHYEQVKKVTINLNNVVGIYKYNNTTTKIDFLNPRNDNGTILTKDVIDKKYLKEFFHLYGNTYINPKFVNFINHSTKEIHLNIARVFTVDNEIIINNLINFLELKEV
jgi:hypothetical protein